MRVYETYGLERVLKGRYPGRVCRLDECQRGCLKKKVTAGHFSSLQQVQDYILETFDQTYSIRGLRYLLERLGHRFQTQTSAKKPKFRSRGRPKKIDTSGDSCTNADCKNFAKKGPDNQIIGAGRYGKARTQLLKCKVCGKTFSARWDTVMFGSIIDDWNFPLCE